MQLAPRNKADANCAGERNPLPAPLIGQPATGSILNYNLFSGGWLPWSQAKRLSCIFHLSIVTRRLGGKVEDTRQFVDLRYVGSVGLCERRGVIRRRRRLWFRSPSLERGAVQSTEGCLARHNGVCRRFEIAVEEGPINDRLTDPAFEIRGEKRRERRKRLHSLCALIGLGGSDPSQFPGSLYLVAQNAFFHGKLGTFLLISILCHGRSLAEVAFSFSGVNCLGGQALTTLVSPSEQSAPRQWADASSPKRFRGNIEAE